MRGLGLVIVVLAAVAVGFYLQTSYHPVTYDPNNRSKIEYWMSHSDDRALTVDFCSHHPEERTKRDCVLATAAQRRIDYAAHPEAGGGNGSSDQNTAGASDELEAQKDANQLP